MEFLFCTCFFFACDREMSLPPNNLTACWMRPCRRSLVFSSLLLAIDWAFEWTSVWDSGATGFWIHLLWVWGAGSKGWGSNWFSTSCLFMSWVLGHLWSFPGFWGCSLTSVCSTCFVVATTNNPVSGCACVWQSGPATCCLKPSKLIFPRISYNKKIWEWPEYDEHLWLSSLYMVLTHLTVGHRLGDPLLHHRGTEVMHWTGFLYLCH